MDPSSIPALHTPHLNEAGISPADLVLYGCIVDAAAKQPRMSLGSRKNSEFVLLLPVHVILDDQNRLC